LRIVEEFWELKLKDHSYLCEDASKFKEVDSSEHATLVVLNLTHPVGVRYTALEYGVGTWTSLRAGGANTATNKRPTIAPVNIQKIENILLVLGQERELCVSYNSQIHRSRGVASNRTEVGIHI